ncbi:hypothetical protein KIN20_022759 [Parelaphostrongylus tenuis]|uniref:Uncharacterized protein n=1 Tax=Parelaphostrongylus tenuis TaxID=148309 RepID=A0AAD5NBS9_PARTN|nr:hypothetical protein KIN20_022759 [Parelaphostrongylus tenuis]
MKRASENADTTVVPRKCIKLNSEELKSADTATLIEKILSTTDQLNEANEVMRTLKARVAVCRRQVSQKDKELKDLVAKMETAGVVKIEWFQASKCLQSRETCAKEVGGIANRPRKGRPTTSSTSESIQKIQWPCSTKSTALDAHDLGSSGSTIGASETLSKISWGCAVTRSLVFNYWAKRRKKNGFQRLA